MNDQLALHFRVTRTAFTTVPAPFATYPVAEVADRTLSATEKFVDKSVYRKPKSVYLKVR